MEQWPRDRRYGQRSLHKILHRWNQRRREPIGDVGAQCTRRDIPNIKTHGHGTCSSRLHLPAVRCGVWHRSVECVPRITHAASPSPMVRRRGRENDEAGEENQRRRRVGRHRVLKISVAVGWAAIVFRPFGMSVSSSISSARGSVTVTPFFTRDGRSYPPTPPPHTTALTTTTHRRTHARLTNRTCTRGKGSARGGR